MSQGASRSWRYPKSTRRCAAVFLAVGWLWCSFSLPACAAENPRPSPASLPCLGDETNALPELRTERALHDVSFPGTVVVTNRFAVQPLRFRLTCPAQPASSASTGDPPPEECLLMPEIELGASKLVITACLKPGEYAERCGDGLIRVFDRDGAQLTAMDPFGSIPELRPGASTLNLRAQYPIRARLLVLTSGK